jgi:hypothetical protein
MCNEKFNTYDLYVYIYIYRMCQYYNLLAREKPLD